VLLADIGARSIDVRFTYKSDIDRDTPFCLAALDSPKVFEPRRRQFAVADGVPNVAVAEIGLQRTGIDAFVRQSVPRPERSYIEYSQTGSGIPALCVRS
jgi:hypothetical protein